VILRFWQACLPVHYQGVHHDRRPIGILKLLGSLKLHERTGSLIGSKYSLKDFGWWNVRFMKRKVRAKWESMRKRANWKLRMVRWVWDHFGPCTSARNSAKKLEEIGQLILDCPATESLRRAFLGTNSIFDLWSRPWSVSRILILRGVPPRPNLSKGIG